jgi:hypothetical protein
LYNGKVLWNSLNPNGRERFCAAKRTLKQGNHGNKKGTCRSKLDKKNNLEKSGKCSSKEKNSTYNVLVIKCSQLFHSSNNRRNVSEFHPHSSVLIVEVIAFTTL